MPSFIGEGDSPFEPGRRGLHRFQLVTRSWRFVSVRLTAACRLAWLSAHGDVRKNKYA